MNQPNSPTQQKPTTAEGDPTDGSGEDNHTQHNAPGSAEPHPEKAPAGEQSPQQEHNDEDHG